MRRYGQKLYHGKIRLGIRKNFLTKREGKLEQAAQGSGGITALEAFKTRVVFWHMGTWLGGGLSRAGLTTGLVDLR